MTYEYLKKNILGKCCRSCINKKYKIKLEPKDCIYMEYQYECQNCKKLQNIVLEVRGISRYKVWFGKK